MYMHEFKDKVTMKYDDPVVLTKAGALHGAKVDGTYTFRGVKYASAKRFHLPVPVEPWEGVKPALAYSPVCPEVNSPLPGDEPYVPHFYFPQSEDCLSLNIWTQSLDKNHKRPVMVWLHGGGWFSGSSVEIFSYDGENLSRFGDVVVVSINHRLNVLGYLDLSAYGDEYKYSANAGVADMVEALKWVHDNIENFGGDPDNVTIFGQSGGGSKVLSLMQSPYADGLYHRAILQSGGVKARYTEDKKEVKKQAQKVASLVLERLGISPENVADIEKVDFYDLAQAAGEAMWIAKNELHIPFMWGPVADEDYYFGHPAAHGFRKESSHIPMMVGNVFGEFFNNINFQVGEGHKNSWSEEYKAKLFEELYGKDYQKYVDLFRKAYPDHNTADMIFLDKARRAANNDFCKLRAGTEGAAPIYNFLFAIESPFLNGTVPWHNFDEPYVFHNVEYTESQYEPGVSEELQDKVSGAWVAFAEKGDPNIAALPEWEPVKKDSCRTMVFDRTCRLSEPDFDLELSLKCPTPDLSKQKKAGDVFPGLAGATNGFPVE